MKITDVKAYPVGERLQKPLRWGAIAIDIKGGVVVEVSTDEGITGYGEAGFSVEFFPLVGTVVQRELAPLLIGEDPRDISRLWEKMFLATHLWGRRGVQTYAISGVDIALWDILGKISGQPIHRLLGSAKQAVRAYFAPSLKDYDTTVQEAIEGADRGFTAIKLRLESGPREAIALVGRVKESVGDRMEISVDANMAFDRHEALLVAHAFEEMGVIWFEEPVRTRSYSEYVDAHVWLHERVNVPISGGEQLLTRYEFVEPMRRRAFDIVQPDCTAVGGITEGRRIADMASAHGLQCINHIACSSGIGLAFAANLHMILSATNAPMIEYDAYGGPAWDGLYESMIEIRNGLVTALDSPGLGLTFAEGALDHYRLDRLFGVA